MITHEQALDLAATALDFELSERDRVALDTHVAACPSCPAEIASLRRDAIRLRSLPPIAPPDWVAHAIGRTRRPVTMLLLAAVLLIGGSIGALALAGSSPTTPTPSLDVVSVAPTASSQATVGPPPLPRVAGWTPGRAMAGPRSFHIAIRLSNGEVLIAGGGFSGGNLASAELYDPATDSFRPAASMSRPRANTTATLLLDGRVLVAGSNGATAELYDPATDSWAMTGSMLEQRSLPAAALLPDGRVLVVGGAEGNAALRTAEIFDPATGQWSSTPPGMSVGRYGFTATRLADGRVLVAGGVTTQTGIDPLDSVEIFDPVTGTFTEAPPMHQARARHTAVLLADGRLLVAFGIDGGSVLASSEVFDPATGTWMEVGDAEEPRESHSMTLLADGGVIAVGGYSQGTTTTELFNPASGTWGSSGDTSTIRGFHGATLLADGRVLVTGGIDDTQTQLASTELWLAEP